MGACVCLGQCACMLKFKCDKSICNFFALPFNCCEKKNPPKFIERKSSCLPKNKTRNFFPEMFFSRLCKFASFCLLGTTFEILFSLFCFFTVNYLLKDENIMSSVSA